MSIRISVEWTNIQKFLKILEGTLSVIYFDFNNTPIQKELYKCYVKITEGSISYSAIDRNIGIPTILSQLLNDQTQAILRAYYNGFILHDHVYTWVESSHGYSPHEWAVKQYESLSKTGQRNFENTCFDHELQKVGTKKLFKTKIIESLKRLEYNNANKEKS